MKILRGYQKQTRAGDGKLKPQFPRPNCKNLRKILQCRKTAQKIVQNLHKSENLG